MINNDNIFYMYVYMVYILIQLKSRPKILPGGVRHGGHQLSRIHGGHLGGGWRDPGGREEDHFQAAGSGRIFAIFAMGYPWLSIVPIGISWHPLA